MDKMKASGTISRTKLDIKKTSQEVRKPQPAKGKEYNTTLIIAFIVIGFMLTAVGFLPSMLNSPSTGKGTGDVAGLDADSALQPQNASREKLNFESNNSQAIGCYSHDPELVKQVQLSRAQPCEALRHHDKGVAEAVAASRLLPVKGCFAHSPRSLKNIVVHGVLQ